MPEYVDNPNGVTFTVDRETRTIRGLALPYGDVATSGGRRWSFSKGTLNTDRVKLLNNHDWNQVLGVASFEDTDEGLEMTAKVVTGPRGDELLALSEMGAIDGLSIGLGDDVKATVRDGVHHVNSGTVRETSTTPIPAFARASITSVAASAAQDKESIMDDENKPGEAETPVSFTADQGQALTTKVDDLEKTVEGLKEFKAPVTPTPGLQVTEEPIYRFAGSEPAPSGFDFATDMLNAANGDLKALDRVKTFTAEHITDGPQFVDTTDTSNVNPATYRPDMFLGQAPTPTSPLYDTFHKSSLSSVQPFFWSKLDRANTDAGVADHTEGTDPTDGDVVTATGATVTPAPVSAKVHITREVGDQGGNPNVSGLVWNEFTRSFSIALETKTAALITTALGSITALATPAAGAAGDVAGQAVEAGLVGLQFIPDGSRFTKAFGHVDLYTLLATYENTDGEKRYPIINPQNRSGVSGGKYSFIDVAGYRMEPAHSLGATGVNEASILADPGAVHVWNSGLQRLDKLNESVEGWDLGCFGYWAGIVYDITGLRKVQYALA